MRIGHGFDIHKFGGRNPLVLGGVNIPFVSGLLAHSDGDVMLHAIMDALLGAVSLGDIGSLFPSHDISLRGVNSRKLLRIVWKHVVRKGYSLGNLDITLIIQVPTIISYFPKMSFNLSNDLQCKTNDVNIKSTTTEGLGCIGRREGIACEAVVLLQKNY